MLAIIGNLSWFELALVALLAVLVFGRRLPQVAMDAARQLYRLRRALSEMSREAGLDDEIRDLQRSVRDATRADVREPSSPARKSPPRVEPNALPPAPQPAEREEAMDRTTRSDDEGDGTAA